MPALASPRRAERRYRCTRWHAVRLVNWAVLDVRRAALRDVSRRGIGLLTRQPFELGTVLDVHLGAGRAGAPALLRANVRHATRLPGGTWLVGCSLSRSLAGKELLALL